MGVFTPIQLVVSLALILQGIFGDQGNLKLKTFWDLYLTPSILITGQEADRPLVDTKYGKLLGATSSVRGTDRSVHVFLGIPFAKPPVGNLRFAHPDPPESWSSVRDASQPPAMCLQSRKLMKQTQKLFLGVSKLPQMSEDCLTLNIYTPADREGHSQLPVMVFIHGGILLIGTGTMFDGSALSAYENLVVVSIQYRLGILGFLCTGDKRAPGNYGFFDQVAALQWVQENIKDFGGDPKSVTIFGESAGAVSVGALVLSPLAKGLFHSAIAESGTATIPALMATNSEILMVTQHLISKVSDCPLATLVDCLKTKTEDELAWFANALDIALIPGCVDGEFLPKPAEHLLANHEINNVPLLIGVNEGEFGWLLPMSFNFSRLVQGSDKESILAALRQLPGLGIPPKAFDLIMEEHIGDTNDPSAILNRFLELCGDVVFVVQALKTARYHRDSGFPVYFYEFQHRPSLFNHSKPAYVKADQGDELFFVMGGPFLSDTTVFNGYATDDETILSKTMMKYWANFARTGDPNGPGMVTWPRYNEKESYLQINLTQKAGRNLKGQRLEFWTIVLPWNIRKILEDTTHTEL
ncbi:fatty acyl-CoA hydrolase precursor, medium chain-like [Pelodytes ibericus]